MKNNRVYCIMVIMILLFITFTTGCQSTSDANINTPEVTILSTSLPESEKTTETISELIPEPILEATPEPLILNKPEVNIKPKSIFTDTYFLSQDVITEDCGIFRLKIEKGIYYHQNISKVFSELIDIIERFNGMKFKPINSEELINIYISPNRIGTMLDDNDIYLTQEEMFFENGKAIESIAGILSEKLIKTQCDIPNETLVAAVKYLNMMYLPEFVKYNSYSDMFYENKFIVNNSDFLAEPEQLFTKDTTEDREALGFRIAGFIDEKYGPEKLIAIMQKYMLELTQSPDGGMDAASILKSETEDSVFMNIANWSEANSYFKSSKYILKCDDKANVIIFPTLGVNGWHYEPFYYQCAGEGTIDFTEGLNFLNKLGNGERGLKGTYSTTGPCSVMFFKIASSKYIERKSFNKSISIDFDNAYVNKTDLRNETLHIKITNSQAINGEIVVSKTNNDDKDISVSLPAATPAPNNTQGGTNPEKTPGPDQPSFDVKLNEGIINSYRMDFTGPLIPNINTDTFVKSDKDTILENNQIKIYIDPGMIYSKNLLSYVDGLMTEVENTTGLSFFNNTNKSYGKVVLRIWGGYVAEATEDYISLSAEYAIAEGGTKSWDLAYELTKHILYRNCIPYVKHYTVPAISNPTLEQMVKDAEEFPDVFIDSYAFDCADRIASKHEPISVNNSYSRYYLSQNANTNMQDPEYSFKMLYGDKSKPFAFKFMIFMKDKYGDDVLFEIMNEVQDVVSFYVKDYHVISIMEKLDSINEDVFAAFKTWYASNSSYFNGAEENRVLDFTGLDSVEIVPEIRYYNMRYPFLLIDYDGSLTFDFRKGFELLQIYGSKPSEVGIALTLKGEHIVEFFDINDDLIKSFYVGDIIFIPHVKGAVKMRISGEASRLRFYLYDNDMYTEAEWLPSNLRVTELPPEEIDITPSTPEPNPIVTNPTDTNPPSTNNFRTYGEINNFIEDYKTVATEVGNINLNISVTSGGGLGMDYHFLILAAIPSAQFYDLFINEIYPQYTDTVKNQLESHMSSMAQAVIGYANYQSLTGGYTGGPNNVINCAWKNYSDSNFQPGSFRWISQEWNWIIMMD